jgi:hypothetical protein
MSITVIGAFSRMGIQAPSTSSAIISKPKQSSKETSNRTPEPPRLHGDILHKIFNILHDESPSFLFPVLQVNHSFYELVMPILYRIIHLNRTTLRGLMDDPDDRRCWAWYWHNQTELARATTLVINDLYVLLDTRYDAALRKLCHRVRLPNVAKLSSVRIGSKHKGSSSTMPNSSFSLREGQSQHGKILGRGSVSPMVVHSSIPPSSDLGLGCSPTYCPTRTRPFASGSRRMITFRT